MIRAVFFSLQVILLIALGVWMFTQPGWVRLNWMGYDVEAHIGLAFIALVLLVLTLVAVYRVLDFLFSLPKRLRGARDKKRRDRGIRALTLGLAAVSAGDSKQASAHAFRMRQYMPDEEGLPWLLEAQAARLRGAEDEAAKFFEKLMKNKDTAFLGVRGLLHSAIEHDDPARALPLARQALTMHPGQSWIIRTVFNLEIRQQEWATALLTLKRGERAKTWTPEEITSTRIALYLQQAEEQGQAGFGIEVGKKLREALRLDPSYVPTVLRIARYYHDHGKRRAAVAVVERAWRDNPHPDLVPVWDMLMPRAKARDMTARLRWYERLVALNPGHVESQIAAAQAAMDDGLWGESWQYLAAGEKIQPCARLYRLWAQVEEKTGHSESAKRYWEKAASAAVDRVWTCVETGRIYDEWSPIARPHGAFNTIRWDFPMTARKPDPVLIASAGDITDDPVRLSAV